MQSTQSVQSTLGTQSGASQQFVPAFSYEGDGFNVALRNLSFSKKRDVIAVALRITNTSDKNISLSYIKSSLTVSDDKRSIFKWKDVWSGLRGCGGYNYEDCVDSKSKQATGIKAGKSSQLTFNLSAGKVEKVGALTIGFEVVHNADTSQDCDWSTTSIGLFDLPVKSN